MKFKIFLIIFQLIQSENVKLRNNDYIFDLTKSKPTTTGLAGEARSANIDSMPILQGKGVSNVLFHIHACAVNLHNIHPRSSELLFVISGIFRVAFVEENNGRILINKIRTGQVTLFPQGLIHEVVNISCNNGSFISVFGDEDPGILQVASRLFQIPEEALTSTFNISKLNVKYLKSRIQQNPSTGFDSECLTRCKINK